MLSMTQRNFTLLINTSPSEKLKRAAIERRFPIVDFLAETILGDTHLDSYDEWLASRVEESAGHLQPFFCLDRFGNAVFFEDEVLITRGGFSGSTGVICEFLVDPNGLTFIGVLGMDTAALSFFPADSISLRPEPFGDPGWILVESTSPESLAQQ